MFRRLPVSKLLALSLAAGGIALASLAAAQDTGPSDPPVGTYVLPPSGPFSPDKVQIPNMRAISSWIRSGHADASGEAFSHWDGEGSIPPVCSTCHSGPGFRSFHGLDGSEPGLPAEPVPTGSVVDCATCHDPNLSDITEITLPSGVVHPVSTSDAACTTCHQGRAAGASVTKAVGDKAEDTPDPELGFVNPHYALAAVSMLGGYGAGGYQYPGKTYTGRFLHAKPVSTCLSCHDPHSLEVAQDTCLTCHQTGDPKAIRISRQSYDGSGDVTKGIAADIGSLSDQLMAEIKAYAAQVAGVAIIYDGGHYPYFFADANGDGLADQADGRGVAYKSWTPRLLKAAYNWKFVSSDHGIHVHNPHYALELLYDSAESLSGPAGTDFEALNYLR